MSKDKNKAATEAQNTPDPKEEPIKEPVESSGAEPGAETAAPDPLLTELERLKDRAYGALFSQCPEFRQALADLNGEPMAHSIGKRDARRTILTEYDFLRRLELLRSRL